MADVIIEFSDTKYLVYVLGIRIQPGPFSIGLLSGNTKYLTFVIQAKEGPGGLSKTGWFFIFCFSIFPIQILIFWNTAERNLEDPLM